MSLMCHPDREPRIELAQDGSYELFENRTPNYAEAYRVAIARAAERGMDLVTADTDGYHPPAEITRLALSEFGDGPVLVLPYRVNIGFQSKAYSLGFSLLARRRVRDATGGLCRLSLELMKSLPPLKSTDMTVHIEILRHALQSKARLVQYGYRSGTNDESESRRTSHYQWKLLKAALR
ncbi:MAG: hypothetical protein JRN08_03390 [Nitrososphaerota archaeon]|nr:hypothetical protein [Nitrososphaerota archaeon]